MSVPATPASGEGPGYLLSSYPKTAIVVLHGMGEQRPMDTIRGFARAVWGTDATVWPAARDNPGEIWSKPDSRTGSLELRRLTTRESKPNDRNPNGVRQDFYELYWADLSGGTTWDQVKSWLLLLLLRNPFTNVPRGVFFTWIVLWLVTLLVVSMVVAGGLAEAKMVPPADSRLNWLWRHSPVAWFAGWPTWLLAGALGVLAFVAQHLIVPYFGRVVRYTQAKPENIAARAAIRERGLKLLDELHKLEYDRIVIVAHSLGSIVAYDLVAHFWAKRAAARTVEEKTPEFEALRTLEGIGAEMAAAGKVDQKNVDRWHAAQRRLGRLLRRRPRPAKEGDIDTRWLITDLITVGSPLGHADFLIANDEADRQERVALREFAVCPPVRERIDAADLEAAKAGDLPTAGEAPALFCFRPNKAKTYWQLHHAAQFAAMRWTNIHDPAVATLIGDVISAPARPIYGPGVVDIDVTATYGGRWWFTHTLYWDTTYWEDGTMVPGPLHSLRQALNLPMAGDI